MIFSGSEEGTEGLTAAYSEQTSASDSFTGTNGNSNFTGTATSDGVELATGSIGALDGYWVGNGGDNDEVHSHVFSQEIAGAQILFNTINTGETFYIVIDRQTINLNDAIVDGDVTFDGAPDYEIDANGEIILSSGGDLTEIGTLTINAPFTTIDVAVSGSSGVIYQIYADTNPPYHSDDDFLSGGDDTVIGGEGGNDDDLIDLSGLSGPVTVTYTGDEAGTITNGTDTITFSEIERVILTDQNDSVDGSADSVGINIVDGGGNDTIYHSGGQNTTSDGSGNADTVQGGEGNDTIVTFDGDDSIEGGKGGDIIDSGTGNDAVDGGDGDDSILGWMGDDTLEGGAGNDTIDGSPGNDSIDGGDGNDTVSGGAGNDTIVGGAGENLLSGGDDDDQLFGNSSNETLSGDAGNEQVFGGGGDDVMSGGTGNDTLVRDTGNDTFVYNVGDGSDTISDFNAGNTGMLNDNDSTNNDFVDLSGFYDNIFELHADQADDGVLNQSNTTGPDAVDYSNND